MDGPPCEARPAAPRGLGACARAAAGTGSQPAEVA